jgi:hypothetical protein
MAVPLQQWHPTDAKQKGMGHMPVPLALAAAFLLKRA